MWEPHTTPAPRPRARAGQGGPGRPSGRKAGELMADNWGRRREEDGCMNTGPEFLRMKDGGGGLLLTAPFPLAQTLTWIGSRNDGSRACHAGLQGLPEAACGP